MSAWDLRPYLRSERRVLAGGCVALVAAVAFRLLSAWPVQRVVDTVIAPDAGWLGVLAAATLTVAVFATLGAVASTLTTAAFTLAGGRASTALRTRVFDHLHRMSPRYHDRARPGELGGLLVGDVGRLRDAVVTAPALLGAVLTLLGTTAVMVVLDPVLALSVLAALPVFLLSGAARLRRDSAGDRARRRREDDLAGTAAESLAALRLVQAYGLEPVVGARFARSNHAGLGDRVRAARLAGSPERRTDLFLGLAGAIVLFSGGARVLAGALTLGELVVFGLYLAAAGRPLRDVARHTDRLGRATASGARILDLLRTPPEVADRPDSRPAPPLRGELRFEGVNAVDSFGHPVLREVSLHVPAGTRLGVVGLAGAGTSTLVALLLRLADPVSGAVLVDGHDLRDLRMATLRRQIALVSRDPALFATTVRENIRYGRPEAEDAAIRRAAELAGAHEFVAALPDGYDTVLGEPGPDLSGEQRQRLAIARAALRDAPIVVLDEATAALDAVATRAVSGALGCLTSGRTTIVLSPDLAGVADCDRVVGVADGRIVEPRLARN